MADTEYNWYDRKIFGIYFPEKCSKDMNKSIPGFDETSDVQTRQKIRAQTKTPKMYRVVLLNDDYTTMDFVVEILISVFGKPAAEATRIMLDVHKRGSGVCGVYTHDIAQTKVNQVHQKARKRQFPLRCSCEEA